MNFLVPESLASFSVVCVFIIICSLSSLVQVQARQFYVGGRDGWVVHPKEDYAHWAGRNRFLINDTLLFKYKKGENSVLLVNKDGYDKCDAHDPIKKWDDGNTVFQLDRAGPFYFISGHGGNCRNGQKLTVVVLVFRPRPLPLPPPKALPPQRPSLTPATAPGAAPGSKPPGSSTPATSPASSTSPAATPTHHAPAMGPSSRSPTPTAAPGSSTPAKSPSPSTSPPATPTHGPAMGPSSLSPSPTAAPGSSTPASSPSPSTSPATTPTHAPATGPSPSGGPPSSAPTGTAPASGATAPGASGASPPAPSTTSPSPGGSAQSSPPAGTPGGLPANVTSPPPGNSGAQVVNPLGMWTTALLMMVLGQI